MCKRVWSSIFSSDNGDKFYVLIVSALTIIIGLIGVWVYIFSGENVPPFPVILVLLICTAILLHQVFGIYLYVKNIRKDKSQDKGGD